MRQMPFAMPFIPPTTSSSHSQRHHPIPNGIIPSETSSPHSQRRDPLNWITRYDGSSVAFWVSGADKSAPYALPPAGAPVT